MSETKFHEKLDNIQEFSSDDEEDQINVPLNEAKCTDDVKNVMELVFGNKDRLLKSFKQEDVNETELKIKRKPVWQDSDDEYTETSTVLETRKKIKYIPQIDDGSKYKDVLQRKFEKVVGIPNWANLDKLKEEQDSDDEILQTVGHISKPSNKILLKNTLKYKRLKDLNRVTYSEGPVITAVEFHPASKVAIVCGLPGIATLYSIDGYTNDKLHSMCFKKFPIKDCKFSNDGKEVFFGGSSNNFYTYDLLGGQTSRILLPKVMTKMNKFELSPCGKFLVVIGRFGEIHMLNSGSKELIGTLKQEHPCTGLAFSPDSSKLFSHSSDNEVTVFDIRSNKTMHRFVDDGCIQGTTISISSNGKLLATGSAQGVVNAYNYENCLNSKFPVPEKVIYNLTTRITATKFNPSSEILAIGSDEVNDALRLVHFPSGTVFDNFPGSKAKFGRPNVISFSPGGKYFAVGNTKTEVALINLRHYQNY